MGFDTCYDEYFPKKHYVIVKKMMQFLLQHEERTNIHKYGKIY